MTKPSIILKSPLKSKTYFANYYGDSKVEIAKQVVLD